MTRGIAAQGEAFVTKAIDAVRTFSSFTPDNDPHGEHDFGSFTIQGQRLFWKIDAYDQRGHFASPDPSDPNVTLRVLTIMLASEY